MVALLLLCTHLSPPVLAGTTPHQPGSALPAAVGETIGRIDSVVFQDNEYHLHGWACQKAHPSSIDVHVYVGGDSSTGIFMAPAQANLASEPAIAALCETTGVNHRFLIPVDFDQITSHPGEGVYIHAISPSGPPHPLLLQSGTIEIPDRVHLSYVTTHDASFDLNIPDGLTVLIDQNLVRGILSVNGGLECFDNGDYELNVQGIHVSGPEAHLTCGREEAPFEGTIDFTFADNRPVATNSTQPQPGKEFIVSHGATLRLIGRTEKSQILKLSRSALVHAHTIDVAPPATGWERGDTIVIAPTGFRPHEAEERTLVDFSEDRRQLILDAPLDYFHWGRTEAFASDSGMRWVLDERAEVINLSRRIRVMSEDDHFVQNAQIGAHMMIMGAGSAAFVDGVEFHRVGQMGQLRRYPFHWHLLDDATGQYIKNSSVHHSFNRCIVVHGTDSVEVEGNSCYDHFGHGFFLEDGSERRNVLRANIGILSRKVPPGRELLESESKDLQIGRFPGPATFWISHPDNEVADNVAAGSEGSGFWMAFSRENTCPQLDCAPPTKTDTLFFGGNIAHSSKVGITHDGGPNGPSLNNPRNPADRAIVTTHYEPEKVPIFENLQAFKNSVTGIYFRGDRAIYRNNILADNGASFFFAFDQEVEDSLVVGMSQNMSSDDLEYLDQTPFRLPDDLIGVLVYDGPFFLKNVHFANFPESPLDHQGAPFAPTAIKLMGGLARYVNKTSGLSFYPPNPYKKVDLRRVGEPRTAFWSDSYTASIRDLDGSLSGLSGAEIRPDHPLNWDESRCSAIAEWGAFACDYRTTHLRFRNRVPFVGAVETQQLGFSIRRDSTSSLGVTYPYLSFPNAIEGRSYNKFSIILDEGYSYHVTDYPVDLSQQVVDLFFTSETAGQLSPVLSVELPLASPTCALYNGYASPANHDALPNLGTLGALESSSEPGFVRVGATIHFRLRATMDKGRAYYGIYGLRC